jgi:exopolysaccharide biosynthesis WecB/TagA/CpsF family protein
MYRVCEQAAKRSIPIFLFGSKQPVLDALESNLLKWFPNLSIAGSEPSQFRRLSFEENSALMNRIRSSGAALTFIGLGCPRQEIWVCENQEALSMPIMAVGAAFDFHAGSYGQAPGWMQRAGLEWLYRFITEPRRLWRRYLLLNPYYLWLLLSQKLGIRDFNPMDASPPTEKLRFG